MDLPVIVTHSIDIPISMQLKYQLSYLIASNKMRSGSKMPSVRDVAGALHISPGTVANAYQQLAAEGLLEMRSGRGTYVAVRRAESDGVQRRQELLSAVIAEACERATGLGFDSSEIHQRFLLELSHRPRPRRVAFVAHRPAIAAKYAQLLERHFVDLVSAEAVCLDDLQNADQALLQRLAGIYFFIGAVRLQKQIEEQLDRLGQPYEFVGTTTDVTRDTIDRLSSVRPDSVTCLVTERPYVHSSLNIIVSYSQLRPDSIRLAVEPNAAELRTVARPCELVFFTTTLRDVLREARVPRDRWFELGIDFSRESLADIRERVSLG
jgi:GntR family transcriptional regulator